MKIRINSRNLDDLQQARIKNYFHENFSLGEKVPTLIWQEEETDFILLGYGHGIRREGEVPDASSIMFRVHENELLDLVGRTFSGWRDERTFRM